MDVGYAASAYDCHLECVRFLLFRYYHEAEWRIPLLDVWGRRCYLPLQVDLGRFVNPAKVTVWPVLIKADHPGYRELRRSWFDTIAERSRDAVG